MYLSGKYPLAEKASDVSLKGIGTPEELELLEDELELLEELEELDEELLDELLEEPTCEPSLSPPHPVIITERDMTQCNKSLLFI